jgi:TPR repeat protein
MDIDDEISDVMKQLQAGTPPAKVLTKLAAQEVEQLVQESSMEEVSELAQAHWNGECGVELDKSKAAALWKAAAAMGDPNAQYSFAMSLKSGEGTEDGKPRPVAAARELISLAERGHPWAQFALADALLKGEGVKVNEEEALVLFKISAQNGVAPALFNIGNLYAEGKGTGIPPNDETACEWYVKASDAGDPMAMFTLGTRYCQGKGVLMDWDKGFEYSLKAAQAPIGQDKPGGSRSGGLPRAHFNVGNHYFMGKGVEQDLEAAARHYEVAAKGGFVWAMINLGNMYNEGRGLKHDKSAAEWWYGQAAPHSEHARLLLKELLEKVESVHRDEADAGPEATILPPPGGKASSTE